MEARGAHGQFGWARVSVAAGRLQVDAHVRLRETEKAVLRARANSDLDRTWGTPSAHRMGKGKDKGCQPLKRQTSTSGDGVGPGMPGATGAIAGQARVRQLLQGR